MSDLLNALDELARLRSYESCTGSDDCTCYAHARDANVVLNAEVERLRAALIAVLDQTDCDGRYVEMRADVKDVLKGGTP